MANLSVIGHLRKMRGAENSLKISQRESIPWVWSDYGRENDKVTNG